MSGFNSRVPRAQSSEWTEGSIYFNVPGERDSKRTTATFSLHLSNPALTAPSCSFPDDRPLQE